MEAAKICLCLGAERLFDGFKAFGKIDYGLFHVFDPFLLVMQRPLQIIELDLSRVVHHPLHRRLNSCALALVRGPPSYPKQPPEIQSHRPRFGHIAVQRMLAGERDKSRPVDQAVDQAVDRAADRAGGCAGAKRVSRPA